MKRREFLRLSLNTIAVAVSASLLGCGSSDSNSSGVPSFPSGEEGVKVPESLGFRYANIEYLFREDGTAKIVSEMSAFYPKGHKADESPLGLKIYYVDAENGSLNGDGLSWKTAMKSINTAINQPDVDAVLIAGGQHYGIDDDGVMAMGTYTGERDVALISVGEPAIISSARAVSWSLYDDAVYRSSSTGGSIPKVIDLSQEDEFGDPLELVEVDSMEELEENCFFFDIGLRVFVKLKDGREPDENILCLRSFANQVSAQGIKWYARNIKWYSAYSGALRYQECGENTIAIVEDCEFGYSSLDGLCVRDIGLSIARRCRSYRNTNDAFNYHQRNGLDPHGIEEDCTGYNSQKSGTGNGSTAHENCRVIRVNCEYYKNKGPGIADIQTSKTFNVAVVSRDNYSSPNSWGFLATDEVEMWIVGCSAYKNSGWNRGGSVAFKNTSIGHIKDLLIDDDIVVADNAYVSDFPG